MSKMSDLIAQRDANLMAIHAEQAREQAEQERRDADYRRSHQCDCTDHRTLLARQDIAARHLPPAPAKRPDAKHSQPALTSAQFAQQMGIA